MSFIRSSLTKVNIPTEPVGAKRPSFSSNMKGTWFLRKTGEGFGILCQAQAYPVPTFR